MKKHPVFTDYRVSKTGEVWSIRRNKKLSPATVGPGYQRVNLKLNKKNYSKYIHRLVLETYKGEANGKVCNHIDFNVKNNNLENLEWITQGENIRHYWKNHPSPRDMSRENNPNWKKS